MTDTMSKSRVWITVDERIKRAFESQASAMGLTSGQLLTKIVKEDYPDTLKMIDALLKIELDAEAAAKRRTRGD